MIPMHGCRELSETLSFSPDVAQGEQNTRKGNVRTTTDVEQGRSQQEGPADRMAEQLSSSDKRKVPRSKA